MGKKWYIRAEGIQQWEKAFLSAVQKRLITSNFDTWSLAFLDAGKWPYGWMVNFWNDTFSVYHKDIPLSDEAMKEAGFEKFEF